MNQKRKALIIGINEYTSSQVNNLTGAESDAALISELLERHADLSKNFDLIDYRTKHERDLLNATAQLFTSDADVALFYFSGHGGLREDLDETIIIPSDYDGQTVCGIRVNDIIHLANKATHINHKFIILDCCNSGGAGDNKGAYQNASALATGVTLICSTEKHSEAIEKHGMGQFSKALSLALEGGAANLLGEITSTSIYHYIESALSSTDQRPIFKTNIREVVSLRNIEPLIPNKVFMRLPQWFLTDDTHLSLDPTFEPEHPERNENNVRVFQGLQQCNRQGLIEPVDAKHMYGAAMNYKACKLTALGKFYYQLVKSGAI